MLITQPGPFSKRQKENVCGKTNSTQYYALIKNHDVK